MSLHGDEALEVPLHLRPVSTVNDPFDTVCVTLIVPNPRPLIGLFVCHNVQSELSTCHTAVSISILI
jgi:hypothetical protein